MKQLVRCLTIAAQVMTITLITGLYTTRSAHADEYSSGSDQPTESTSEAKQSQKVEQADTAKADYVQPRKSSPEIHVGFYGAPSFGLGDPFNKTDYDGNKRLSPGVSLGFMVDIAVSSRVMIGFELSMQPYSVNNASQPTDPPAGLILDLGYTEYRALVNISVNPYSRGRWRNVRVIAGIGDYRRSEYVEDGPGVSIGLVGTAAVNNHFEFFLMPRFHYIVFSGADNKMIQIAAGMKLTFGEA